MDLGDQLTRAARSSCLAIAEGANARSIRVKRTFFERATASNGECAACLDQVIDDDAAPAELIARGREQLERATKAYPWADPLAGFRGAGTGSLVPAK